MKKLGPILIIILCLSVLSLFGFTLYQSVKQEKTDLQSFAREIDKVKIANSIFDAEVVSTPQGRQQGLSGRQRLLKNTGLLFVFPQSGQHSFWMKDMNFVIDIIWINKEGRIVAIKENAQPESYPKSFEPDEPARYVFEINAGEVGKKALKVGNAVQFIK